MSKKLYLECYSGISGDMFVAALLDLGADRDALERALQSLPVGGFQIEIRRVKKSGLDVCDFCVHLDAAHENHDHDMAFLHGSAAPVREHEHEHEHAHGHTHEHRGMKEILSIIEQSAMTAAAKALAARIFAILAEAEAKAHGTSIEEVHFHEVGAVDSIVDIAAAAVCLENLGITQAVIPTLYEGGGFVRCQHGLIPVPVPAVAQIAAAHGLKLHLTGTEGEFVTPTGAAIAAAIRTSERLPERFSVDKVGMGAGKRTYERPNVLRAMLIEEADADADSIVKLESNLDDCSGETLGFVMEQLFAAGAREVYYTPIFMKKNRPAYQLNVICDEERRELIEELIFKETTTIGIRRSVMARAVLKREIRRFDTPLGAVEVKVCQSPSGLKLYPEYRSVAAVCRAHTLDYQTAYRRIQALCEDMTQ